MTLGPLLVLCSVPGLSDAHGREGRRWPWVGPKFSAPSSPGAASAVRYSLRFGRKLSYLICRWGALFLKSDDFWLYATLPGDCVLYSPGLRKGVAAAPPACQVWTAPLVRGTSRPIVFACAPVAFVGFRSKSRKTRLGRQMASGLVRVVWVALGGGPAPVLSWNGIIQNGVMEKLRA